MNCKFCDTVLPDGALFCGECGRAVSADATTQSIPIVPIETPSELDGTPSAAVIVENIFRCPQCGEPISDEDVFCGECGFVLKLTPPPGVASEPTALVEPAVTATPVVETTARVEPEVIDEADVESEPEPDDGGPRRSVPPIAPSKKSLRKVPDPFPWGGGTREGSSDLEPTRVSAPRSLEERFVLQFSTGESITALGAGLVGRNPSSQPGEFVDQLVSIFDAGKSVSKTHLEFGQDGGRFWVSDRYSTNGSTVRQPD
ncbi:MAG: zinc-ribbon domain-containing protein, partial [Pseudolysinimonas sp.]